MKALGRLTLSIVTSAVLLFGACALWAQGGNPPASTKEAGETSGHGQTAAETAMDKSGSAENELKSLEQQWVDAFLKRDPSAVQRIEADNFVFTSPEGKTNGKEQDISDLKSGDFKADSMQLQDLKVRTYGNAAVVTGRNSLKGTYKGKDISGDYAFTDTFVKHNGKWQAVSSQATKIQEGTTAAEKK